MLLSPAKAHHSSRYLKILAPTAISITNSAFIGSEKELMQCAWQNLLGNRW